MGYKAVEWLFSSESASDKPWPIAIDKGVITTKEIIAGVRKVETAELDEKIKLLKAML